MRPAQEAGSRHRAREARYATEPRTRKLSPDAPAPRACRLRVGVALKWLPGDGLGYGVPGEIERHLPIGPALLYADHNYHLTLSAVPFEVLGKTVIRHNRLRASESGSNKLTPD